MRIVACAHCLEDCGVTVPGHGQIMDSGGGCPVCRHELCRRCAGGWCGSAIATDDRILTAIQDGDVRDLDAEGV